MNKLKILYYVYRDILLRKFWLWRSQNSNIHGLVLMFHHVTNETVNTTASCLHTVSQFKNTLMRLKQEGYVFVSIEGALNIVKMQSRQKFAIVTFDDVPESVYVNAYPIMKELEIPFTLFISQYFMDKTGYLSTEQIKKLDKDLLCTIGAHTLTHPSLRQSLNSKEEITESKKQLEMLLGHEVEYFAYPYGKQASVSGKVKKEVDQAGYKCAFGTIDTPISDYTLKNKYYLPRVVIF